MEDSEIFLLKTAHVSQKSVREVEEKIKEFNPDIVAVELDLYRYRAFKKDNIKKRKISLRKILKNPFSSLLHYLLSNVQKKIGRDLGVKPGSEMIKAIEVAKEKNIPVLLIDRDIKITLNRLRSKMGFFEKLKLIKYLIIGSIGVKGKKIDLKEITEDETVDLLINELRNRFPTVAEVLLDERDAYMAHRLLKETKRRQRILGVMGAGHVKGVEKYLKNPESLPSKTKLS
ncbi:MAG: Pheromone shutdown protein TraB containing GTxH motif [Candidatus Methanohalarchaeum thermophilum]|uniref:Pheromone shutdown protein TraB containing GTxH motif n=1 Tax=Methanohalarchaeum thermophilum TaxID=1903181 RepID=A0A1Q6DUE7_METT1|nr:MAG: Pheromone shutdown protein TraB containing GTxH motif [Candidatus Methanohalarchaeum thermophilum]